MFASDNTSFQRALDGVDLLIDATTLGEYGLETVTAARTNDHGGAAAPDASGCSDEQRRRRRITRPRRPRRPSSSAAREGETYSFDFPPSPADEPLLVGPFRIASRGASPMTMAGRSLTRLA